MPPRGVDVEEEVQQAEVVVDIVVQQISNGNLDLPLNALNTVIPMEEDMVEVTKEEMDISAQRELLIPRDVLLQELQVSQAQDVEVHLAVPMDADIKEEDSVVVAEAVEEVVDLDVTSNLHLDIVLQQLLHVITPVQQPFLLKRKQCS